MKTYLECIPCFFRQALEASRIAGANVRVQKEIMNEIAWVLPEFPLSSSPPEMGKIIHSVIKKHTGKDDPYRTIKNNSNRATLRLYPRLKEAVLSANNKLLSALNMAIAGNIIDFGVNNSLNVDREILKILDNGRRNKPLPNNHVFNFDKFKKALHRAETVLYLADNAGEIIFDRILIEEIKRIYSLKKIIFAVREKPIINDVLLGDAYKCGLNKTAEIISSGSDAPGTVLSLCFKQFMKIYRKADMIISKGQGNFEALPKRNKKIFFLFIAKCGIVARDVNCNVGDTILMNIS